MSHIGELRVAGVLQERSDVRAEWVGVAATPWGATQQAARAAIKKSPA
jgi:hypothetical protein